MPKFKFKTEGKFAKNLVPNYKLVPYLDDFLSKEIVGFSMTMNGKEPDYGWHPSGDCTPSPTELYQIAQDHLSNGHEKKFSKAFPVGHFWHALCQYAVVQMGLADQAAIERRGLKGWGETTLKPEVDPNDFAASYGADMVFRQFHYCTGSADVAPLTIDGQDYLVDFKTMNNLQYGKDSTPLPHNVAKKYEAQVNIYMDFFDLDRAIILAIQKDTPHHFKEYMFRRNNALIEAIYDKWQFVSECLDANEPPTQQDDDTFTLNELYEGPIEEG